MWRGAYKECGACGVQSVERGMWSVECGMPSVLCCVVCCLCAVCGVWRAVCGLWCVVRGVLWCVLDHWRMIPPPPQPYSAFAVTEEDGAGCGKDCRWCGRTRQHLNLQIHKKSGRPCPGWLLIWLGGWLKAGGAVAKRKEFSRMLSCIMYHVACIMHH